MNAAAAEGNGLPRRIRLEVERYLACGDVRRGFAQLKCVACHKSTLVAFSSMKVNGSPSEREACPVPEYTYRDDSVEDASARQIRAASPAP